MYNFQLRDYTHKELREFTHHQLRSGGLVFVYDRTKNDVDEVRKLTEKYLDGTITEEERKKWMGDMKGALNISDMKRIEGNIMVISKFFSVFPVGKTWNSSRDIPRESDFTRILGNIKKIRDAWFGLSNTPKTPARPLNTYQKWNDIEKILHDFDYTYDRYINGFHYCGSEFYAGEGMGDL